MLSHRALLWTLWVMFGPLLLACMTLWNGWPLPYGVPFDNGPLALAGFVLVVSFIYLLPLWLIWSTPKAKMTSETEECDAPNQ